MSRKKRSKNPSSTEPQAVAEETPNLHVVDGDLVEPGQEEVEQTSPTEAVPEGEAPVVEEPEAEPLQKQLLRLQADFDNYRKRTLREKQQVSQLALENLLSELLPVVDHFEMGLSTARQQEAEASVIDGFQMVYDQMLSTLKKFKLEPLEAEGAVFDPHKHEAATHIPSEEHAADIVIAQTRRGYMLGDKLLRAAQVVVSSGSSDGVAESGKES